MENLLRIVGSTEVFSDIIIYWEKIFKTHKLYIYHKFCRVPVNIVAVVGEFINVYFFFVKVASEDIFPIFDSLCLWSCLCLSPYLYFSSFFKCFLESCVIIFYLLIFLLKPPSLLCVNSLIPTLDYPLTFLIVLGSLYSWWTLLFSTDYWIIFFSKGFNLFLNS